MRVTISYDYENGGNNLIILFNNYIIVNNLSNALV